MGLLYFVSIFVGDIRNHLTAFTTVGWNVIIILLFFSSAELGDYEEEFHTAALISEFRFVPNQNEEFELDVFDTFKRNK